MEKKGKIIAICNQKGGVERVEVYSDNRVEITLKYQDEYQALKRLLDGAEGAVGP